MWSNWNSRILLVGVKKTEKNNLKKLNVSLSYEPNNSTPRYLSKKRSGRHIPKKLCTRMFIIALFILAPNWKLPRCPSTRE